MQTKSNNTKISQVDNLIQTFFDLGNGQAKLVIEDKAAKIPSAYALEEPQGQLSTKTGARLKPKAFNATVGQQSYWFGQDVLNGDCFKGVGNAKLLPQYIHTIFTGALLAWCSQHKVNPKAAFDNKVLAISVLMPPELYQDASTRKAHQKAFGEAFKHRIGVHVQTDKHPTFQLMTRLERIAPETLIYYHALKVKAAKYIVVIDAGYGTLDIAIYRIGTDQPIATKSLNKGVLHGIKSDLSINALECELIAGKDLQRLDSYFNQVLLFVQQLTRSIDGPTTEYHLIGGAVNLMTNEAREMFKLGLNNLIFGDEYSNVRALANLKAGEQC